MLLGLLAPAYQQDRQADSCQLFTHLDDSAAALPTLLAPALQGRDVISCPPACVLSLQRTAGMLRLLLRGLLLAA
jgi:hypothetical protein